MGLQATLRRFPVRGAAVLVILALAGCGADHATGPGSASAGASATASAAPTASQALSPQQRAVQDADSMLASFVLPPGAVKLPGAPAAGGGVLRQPASQPSTPTLVQKTAWYQVPGAPQSVLAWEREHLSKRYSTFGTGSGSTRAAQFWDQTFALPAITDVLDSRQLILEVTAAGGGKTDIRVDAQVTWLPVRPAYAYIPATATAVTVSLDLGLNADGAKPPAPVTITDPSVVDQFTKIINGLPLFPPGQYSCPAADGKALTLTFRGQSGGPALATATVSLDGCGGVSLGVSDRQSVGLGPVGTGPTLGPQLLKIAGLHWSLSAGGATGDPGRPIDEPS